LAVATCSLQTPVVNLSVF